jgi:hypothetical protein
MKRLLLFLLPMAALAAFTPPLPLVALTKKTQIDVLPLQHLISPITLNVVCLGCAGDGNQIFVSESSVRVWLQRALARTHVVRCEPHCPFLSHILQFGGEGWGDNVTSQHDYTIRVHNVPSISLRAIESVIWDNLRASNPWFKVGMEELPDFEPAYSMDARLMEQVERSQRHIRVIITQCYQVAHGHVLFAGVALFCFINRTGQRVHSRRSEPTSSRSRSDLWLPLWFLSE